MNSNERDKLDQVAAPDAEACAEKRPSDSPEVPADADMAAKLAEAQSKAEQHYADYLRACADLQNYRRRTEERLPIEIRRGKESLILNILGIVDDMERALTADADYESLRSGVDMIVRKLLGVLALEGVKPINAVGQPFDPRLHEAVAVCDDPNVSTETVVEEFRKGYTHEDDVIRATMARVARP